jgi:hypothetical protein
MKAKIKNDNLVEISHLPALIDAMAKFEDNKKILIKFISSHGRSPLIRLIKICPKLSRQLN